MASPTFTVMPAAAHVLHFDGTGTSQPQSAITVISWNHIFSLHDSLPLTGTFPWRFSSRDGVSAKARDYAIVRRIHD